MSGALIESAVIVFREGLEALLLVAAIASQLAGDGARRRLFALYAGALLAVPSTVALAWFVETIAGARTAGVADAIVVFIASALMLYVSGWLFVSRGPDRIQSYLRRAIQKALSGRSDRVIFAVAFLVVLREGAEIVLFLRALNHADPATSLGIVLGSCVGAAILGLVFVFVSAIMRRVALRFSFLVTSLLLFVMAIHFVGEGIASLQEAGYLGRSALGEAGWLDAIGFNPTWEATAAQAAVVCAAVTGMFILAYQDRSPESDLGSPLQAATRAADDVRRAE